MSFSASSASRNGKARSEPFIDRARRFREEREVPVTESTQKKLGRVRPPRVQITYDVETGGAIEMKELPLVVGILADLAGKPEEPLPGLKQRKFVEIDRDNLNEVMSSLKPRLAFRVPNRLEEGEEGADGEEGSALNVELNFRHMDDFHPASVVDQIEPMRKLYEARQRLTDLLAKLDGNDDLDALLQDVAANTEKQEELKKVTEKEEKEGEDSDG
jgi:type VI secretion system protein ImpB